MARPGYPCYRNILTALGCEVVELPCGPETRYQPTVAMLEALDEPVTRAGRRQPGQPDRHRARPRRAGRARAPTASAPGSSCQRRDLPRHLLPGRPRDVVRVGDVARGDRRQLLLQVLLDDRLAAGLAAACRRGCCARSTAWPATSRSARPRLPQLAALGRVHPGELRRGRRARRPLRGQPRPAARRPDPARHHPARPAPTARSTSTPTSRTSPHDSMDLDLPAAGRRRARASRRASTSTRSTGHRWIRFSCAGAAADVREALARLERWLAVLRCPACSPTRMTSRGRGLEPPGRLAAHRAGARLPGRLRLVGARHARSPRRRATPWRCVLTGIWVLFGLDYLIRLALARRRRAVRAAPPARPGDPAAADVPPAARPAAGHRASAC